VVYVDDLIGPLNAGSHTTLFTDLESHVGDIFPVPIVCDIDPGEDPPCPEDGTMVGFAYFRLLSIEGGSDKVIRGYFVSPFVGAELEYNPEHGDADIATGSIALRLSD
jgi:hypothetical protein